MKALKFWLLMLVCALGVCAWWVCSRESRAWAADTPGAPATAGAPTAPGTPAAAALPATKVNPKDGEVMALIPAGEFLMGSTDDEIAAWLKAHPDAKKDDFKNEQPQHKVMLDAFYLYTTEVTVDQYRKFCDDTKRAMPKAPPWGWQGNYPMVMVSWDDAKAYADWAGATLPTEAQWEKAARGGDDRIFPWGNAWPPPDKAGNFADDAGKAKHPAFITIPGYNDGYAETSPVGSFTANPYGVYDLEGNVREWCADFYAADAYANAPAANPTGPDKGQYRIIRGGSWYDVDPMYMRVAYRNYSSPGGAGGNVGIRCVVAATNP